LISLPLSRVVVVTLFGRGTLLYEMGNNASTGECAAFDVDEIRRLEKRFRKLDANGSGTLSPDEFTSLPALEKNPLVKRVIDTFDTDGNGEVDFKEFIEGLSIFSAKSGVSREVRLKYAFKIYDMDKDGFLSNADLVKALKLMVGKNLKDSQLQQVVDKVFQWNNKACDEMINFDEFCTIIGSADLHSKLSFDF